MKPENKAFLEANRHHYDTLVKAFYMKGLTGDERSGMQRVMSEEFQPGYTADLWCPNCVSEMIRRLYQQYDAWLAKNTILEQAPIDPIIAEKARMLEELINPANKEQPEKVKANFPSHKNRRR